MIIVIAAKPLAEKIGVMNEQINTTDRPENQHESTYTLLIRSGGKSSNVFEMVIYPLLILGPLVAIWQFARQPINIPPTGLDGGGCVACVDEFQTLRQVPHSEIKG
jgi:hypothetical protein